MLPPQSIPVSGRTQWWFFTPSVAGTTLVQQHVWQRPPGFKGLVYINLQGAGGAGGNGFTRASNLNKGGGGGGGAGGSSRILIPSALLPDRLFLYLAKGGVPGTTAVTSSIHTLPIGGAAASLILTQAAGGNGGNGTSGAGGTAGTAGSTSTLNQSLTSAGWWATSAGVAGVTGGAPGVAGGNSAWGTVGVYVCGGASGGGGTASDFAGGNITGLGAMPAIAGGAGGGGAGNAGFNNNATLNFNMPGHPLQFMTSGGSGGGSNTTAGTGGRGGDAGYGSGGGGGGAGVTGGAGGLGGDSFCLIGCIS